MELFIRISSCRWNLIWQFSLKTSLHKEILACALWLSCETQCAMNYGHWKIKLLLIHKKEGLKHSQFDEYLPAIEPALGWGVFTSTTAVLKWGFSLDWWEWKQNQTFSLRVCILVSRLWFELTRIWDLNHAFSLDTVSWKKQMVFASGLKTEVQMETEL